MTADLAQAQQAGENVKAHFIKLTWQLGLEQVCSGAFELRLIQALLNTFHGDAEIFFDSFGKFFGYFIFCASEQEWPGAGGQSAPGQRVIFFIECFRE